ncbi:MAG TPA: aldo/keto reductase [Nitrososphaeraceae archaeon]|nr:aldo/keto reductase [Nitrososphaeraceae archaeon]
MTGTFTRLDGYATSEGTGKFAEDAVRKGIPFSHFRAFDGLRLSSIGLGTYLGQPTAEDDRAIEEAVYESIRCRAVNVIDTAINYRAMRSERSIGKALLRLASNDIVSRDQVFVSSKNGYITNDGEFPSVDLIEYIHRMYISTGIIDTNDISSGYNVMNPGYIERCIDKSLTNMHLSTIDLMYIHNAFESWHEDIDKEEFMEMLGKVFEVYEKYRSNNKIRYYGMATWTCFRVQPNSKEYLSLEEVVKLAHKVGGSEHGFRFIQLPYSLAYSEALLLKNQSVGSNNNLSILEAAKLLNVKVFASAPLLQGRLLSAKIPDYMGISDQVAKLVQVIRSSPSIMAPLLGYKAPEHVQHNVKIAKIPPMSESEFLNVVTALLKGK